VRPTRNARRSAFVSPTVHLQEHLLILVFRADGSFDWLLSDDIEPGSGTLAQRGWRYVELALQRHDIQESNYPYHKAVLEGVLEFDRCDCVPSWLSKFFEVS
jgi:hypothetical protein